MPLYHLKCEACKVFERHMLSPAEAKAGVACRGCGVRMARDPNPPSTSVMETLDNGAMVRKLERLSQAEELYRDRARNDPRNKKLQIT